MTRQINIDPDFSVYRLTKRSMQDTAVMNHRKTMSIISHEIENATIVDKAENVIFSSFQRMSKFLPQLDRYRLMAQNAKQIYVFGEMDAELPAIENITYVPLKASDQLAKEWFIVSSGSNYASALATEELSHIDDPDSKRKFKGVWSFDTFLVGILHDWLSGIVGLRTELQNNGGRNYVKRAELISNTIGRMQVRVMGAGSPIIHGELEHIMQQKLHPAYQNIKATQTAKTV